MIDSTKGIAGLKGALRYVRAYRDHVFVVKLGLRRFHHGLGSHAPGQSARGLAHSKTSRTP